MNRYLRIAAAWCLALCLALSMLPVSALAEEAPESETPGTEAPGTEAPGTEAPGTEAPKPETPGTEAPGTETPKPETPESETPKPETPESETPKPETPESEMPGTETPKPETPENSVTAGTETGEDSAGAESTPPEDVLEEHWISVDEPFPDLDITHLVSGESGFYTIDPTSRDYQQMKAELLKGIKSGSSTVTVTNLLGSDFTKDDISTLYFNTLYDYPEDTYFARTAFSYLPLVNNAGVITKINYMPEKISGYSADAYKAAVDAAAAECFTDRMTELEKVVAAHDWLAANCQYDPYVGNGYKVLTLGGVTYGENPKVYTSYGAFVDRNVVCQGYALAMKVLLDRAGVSCCYVSSSAMKHAWNMVNLRGTWYHVDTTHDDPLYTVDNIGVDIAGRVSRENFLFADSEAPAKKHHDWTTEFNYTCPSTYTFPEALKDPAGTAVYLHDGSLYLLGTDGNLEKYAAGSDFSNGTPVASGITSYGNNIAGTFDRKNEVMYFRAYQHGSGNNATHDIYSVDLNKTPGTAEHVEMTLPHSGVGLKMVEKNGVPTLCFWLKFAEYGQLPFLGMSAAAGTDTAILYYHAAKDAKKLNGATVAVDPGTSGAGRLYAASYDKTGKFLGLSKVMDFSGEKKAAVVKNLPGDAASVKLLAVPSSGWTPRTAAFAAS